MSLFLIGLNHKRAPVEVREQIAFDEEKCRQSLSKLADGIIADEALIVSTCNRVEFLLESRLDAEEIRRELCRFVQRTHDLNDDCFSEYFYQYSNEAAAEHLFRVAASLDSLVVGETQILGQIRAAYKIASEVGTARRNLHKLLHHAFHTAKRVRTETEIGGSAVSIASAAVELARKTFGSLAGKNVLIVGAGEMAQAAVRSLKQIGANYAICNRTFEKAALLAAETSAAVVPFENLNEALKQFDAVICSTSAHEFLIEAEAVKTAQMLRGDRPTLFIDISVPRNIAPEISRIENVILADIDDLQTAVSSNMENRRREAVRAETIVRQEVEEFSRSLRLMNIGEQLGLLREKMLGTARAEFAKNRGKLGDLTEKQEQAIENLLFSTVNKIAHPILYGLRRSHEETGAEEFVEILCSLLGSEEIDRG